MIMTILRYLGSLATAYTSPNTGSEARRWQRLGAAPRQGRQLFSSAGGGGDDGDGDVGHVAGGVSGGVSGGDDGDGDVGHVALYLKSSNDSRYGRCEDRLSGPSLKTPLFCRWILILIIIITNWSP